MSFLTSMGYQEVIYSDNHYTQTIYFNNDFYSLPFGFSLKLRRYVGNPQDNISLSDTKYILEEKHTLMEDGVLIKKKKRENLNREEVLGRFSHQDLAHILSDSLPNQNDIPSGLLLKPQVATQYHRRHFCLDDHLRITLDDELQFFAFDTTNASKIGEHGLIQIELKSDTLTKNMEEALSELNRIDAIPSISKKSFCFNRLASYRESKIDSEYRLNNEIPEKEFELKFNNVNLSSGIIFLLLRTLFEQEKNNFIICPEQPYSDEIGAIHRYYHNPGQITRVAYVGNTSRITSKKYHDQNNMVLVRLEHKSSLLTASSAQEIGGDFGKNIGELYRVRKSFWVVNQNSGRVYKIAADNSYTNTSLLGQIEIEYSGIRKGVPLNNPNRIIEADINNLGNILLSSPLTSPYLETTTLTKFEWLSSLR